MNFNRIYIVLFFSLLFAGLHAQQVYSNEDIKSPLIRGSKRSYYEYTNLITGEKLEGECTINYYKPVYKYRVGNYKKGCPDGIHYLYDKCHKVEKRLLYKDGAPVEEVEYYSYEKESISSITTYIRGFKEKYTKYTKDGEIKEVYEYEHQKEGNYVWKEYRNGEVVHMTEYQNKRPHGKSYNAKKSITTVIYYVEGRKEGPYEEYYPNKNIKQKGFYKQRKKDGHWFFYWENGNLEKEEYYEANQLNGVCKYYYPNGKIKEELCYAQGVLNGIKKQWFENGNLKYEVPYKNGSRNGAETTYYENKKKCSEYNYSNGVSHGPYKLYRENGRLMETGEIEYEEYVKRIFYNEKGKKSQTQVKGKVEWKALP